MQSNLAARFIFHFNRANKIMDIRTTQMMSFTETIQTPSRLLKCEWYDKKRKDLHTWKPPHEKPHMHKNKQKKQQYLTYYKKLSNSNTLFIHILTFISILV